MPTKEQFNSVTGGLISIDDDDDVLVETTSSSRIWKYGDLMTLQQMLTML
jgi:hypothetical protein